MEALSQQCFTELENHGGMIIGTLERQFILLQVLVPVSDKTCNVKKLCYFSYVDDAPDC